MSQGMTEEELYRLATTEYPIKGSLEPAMYGFGQEFRRLGWYPSRLPFYFISQHGVSLWDYPQSHDLASRYPVMIVFSKRMQTAWKKVSS